MILHVLPGDATVETFKSTGIDGEIAVCRECLVVGDVNGDTLPEFWENRARFLSDTYPENRTDYHENVVREFAKLTALQSDSEINLWFEYELFCQANMWFCLSLLADSTADVFRVAPSILSRDQIWDGYGSMSGAELKECFESRVKMSRDDIELGAQLWTAFRSDDSVTLERLSTSESPAFPYLREVCLAAMEKESRPRQVVEDIVRKGETDFSNIFREFRSVAGVYGYGDTQVKEIWHDLVL